MEFNEEEANKINTGIYEGVYTPLNLPVSLYDAYTNEFIRAIEKGTGIDYSAIQYGVVPEDLALAMSENVYLFSGAKTFNYVLSTEDIIYNKGKIIPFKEFQEKAFANFELYNKEWLRTEYETALKQSSHVKDWQDFEANKDTFPLLEYRTVGDVNVALECRQKNGMVLPVGHPDWFKYKPMTHYGCRCELYPLQRNEKPITGIPTGLKENQAGFNTDIAKTGQLFDKSHPYFDVPAGYKRFAKRNFDLPIPETPKTASKKIEVEGFEGKHTYGTLTGKALETQKAIEKRLGIKVPDKLLEFNDVSVIKNNKNAYWQQQTKTINLGKYDTINDKSKIVAHELGHANHHALKQIFIENGVKKRSKEFEDLYDIFKTEGKEIGFRDINRKLLDSKEKWSIKGSLYDCIGEVTGGILGGGHTKKYYSTSKGVEFFAHISENYFQGNSVFKEIMPKTYKAGNEYMKKLLNDE